MTGSNKVILVVDDNPGDVFLTRRILKMTSVVNDLVVVDNGEKALDYLFGKGTFAGRDTSQAPVMVLLDQRMPKIDGIEVLQRLRADPHTSTLPVMLFITSTEDADMVKTEIGGPNAFVRKPLEPGQFVQALKELGLAGLISTEPTQEIGDRR
ncbi:MAG: response regulator [Chloroflexi bacterium]|nr:response regulator [Chloroflexota bacterium]